MTIARKLWLGFGALILIFVVGVGVELIMFRPLERAILDARGLTGNR